ncbi:gliding motility-associated C-terminal domain-containing protein [Mangrovimonas sp. TPBH4]|uniref:T9SS type B sorting domain-containing protein n=1 Tax=Mangrovimonas sp. TPBH4 TaxID=1645914 RepID=UPI0006B540B5|nr:gliding motility-associated C-terminal domain-containing protein [Mangrovimonas sp. TPBH4]
MRKITLWILALLMGVSTFGQININENFDSGIPVGWTSTFYASATQSCSGQSVRDNLYSFSNTGNLTSPNIVGESNETDLTISFDYKIVDWSAATNATAAGWGNFIVQYSTNNGTDWVDVDTIDDENHVTSNECASMSYTVAAADLPDGSDFMLRLNITWAGGDYYMYYDNVMAVQEATEAPSCNSVLTMPTDGGVDAPIDGNITWSAASGIPTGYYLTVGTTAGGNDILDNEDVGNVTSYNIGELSYSTQYYITITPYNNVGTTTETCIEQSYTTMDDPTIIVDCEVGPENITYCYGNNDDTTWLFTSSDGSPLRITFNAGGIESCCDDIIIYDGTDNTGAVLYSGNNGGDLSGLTFDSTGDSLFVEIDSDGSVSCSSGSFCCSTEWDFTVMCATCVNPSATYAVVQDCVNGPQFFVEADITDLGSATSLTITDDQGSDAQTITEIGVVSFGPFDNGTEVVITVSNDEDTNCIINSPSLTQDQCELNIVDCEEGPLELNYCYGNNDDTAWLFESTDGSPIRITFNGGGIESCCDDIIIYDGADNTAPVLYFGNNGGNLAGLTFDSTGDSMYFEIDSDGSVSCASGSSCCTTEWDFTVMCATCVNPSATYEVVSDCANGAQFFVEVDVTDIGSATSLTVSDNQESDAQVITEIGLLSFGPYDNGTAVEITLANDEDTNCIITGPSLTQEFCLDNYVDCSEGPLVGTYCYTNGDTNIITFTSNDGTPLNLTFNSGTVESGWDELHVYNTDGTEMTPADYYGNGGDLSGLTWQSEGDTISFWIEADGIFSCSSGSETTIEYTVSCATCINPQATYMVVDDCDNGDQFLIDVDVTSLGDATSVTITDNQGTTGVQVTETGVTQFGPYPFLTDIVITISNDQDVNCIINSQAIQVMACPPDNDNPCNATVVEVNDNDSCDLTTSGTVLAATPSGVPATACGGDPDDDVWFEFTALNEVQLITLLNISGGTFNLDHAVYEGTCDGLVELYCSNNAASVTPELVVGETYYLRVFSFSSNEETTTFDLCIKEAPENTVCENATPFCGEGGALYASNVIGIPSTGQVACLGSIPNPTWNVLQIGESGPINIQIVQNTQFDEDGNPTGTGLDVDFVLWGPFDNEIDYCDLDLLVDCPTCPNNTWNPDFYPFGNIVDCSYSAASVENVTIDNAIEGEIYVLLVTNFNGGVGTIQIEQTNASVDGSGSITSEIEVELGEDQSFCGFPEYVLNAESPFADTYEWYADGFIIEGETSASLTVTETATYTVIAYDENCDTQAQDEVTIVLGLEAIANDVEDIITCDDASGDEIEDFDLEMQTSGILAGQDPSLFDVTYYASLDDAQAGINALSSPYSNITNPQTVYARIEDANATFCFDTTSFDLVISGPTPTVTDTSYNLCDDESGDGVESFDLTSIDADVLNGQDPSIYIVSYYANEADAEAGTNALESPYENTSNPQTIYVRIESNVAYDCYSVGEVVLAVDAVPYASFNTDEVAYEVCPNATVPIEISLILEEGFTADEVTVEWSQDGGLIAGESGLTLPVLTQGTYTAVVTSNASGCSYEVSADVIELENCIIPQGISPNGDGMNDNFDLSSFRVSKIEIFNRLGTLVYSKNNYTNEWYGQTNDGEDLPVGTYFYTMEYEEGKTRSAWVYINK